MARLRVGSVPYLVARPLDADLAGRAGIELVHDVPARLVEALRDGHLDVALVSSIELFRQPGYRYLDGPVIAGRGFVSSVQLFLERPLAELRTVVLDPASRTSQALVQIALAAARPGAEPLEFIEAPLGTHPGAVGGDAWLEIGDQALRDFLAPGAPEVLNPAAIWASETGLPFVFALWIVGRGVELTPEQLEAFAAAPLNDLARRAHWAAEASRAWQLPLERCREYLERECVYEVGDELTPSLTRFRDAAASLGLCEPAFEPRPIALPPR